MYATRSSVGPFIHAFDPCYGGAAMSGSTGCRPDFAGPFISSIGEGAARTSTAIALGCVRPAHRIGAVSLGDASLARGAAIRFGTNTEACSCGGDGPAIRQSFR